jgi:DNA-binding response OmpR family regulator
MGQRVLVVDDDPTVSDVVRRYLERAGFEVVLAGDGRSALRMFEAEPPDLVILDLMLPGSDSGSDRTAHVGLEVCRSARRTIACSGCSSVPMTT